MEMDYEKELIFNFDFWLLTREYKIGLGRPIDMNRI